MTTVDSPLAVSKAFRALNSRLKDMNRLREPVWVYDVDNMRILWGNDACVSLWEANSLEELQGRYLGDDMTETVAKRLGQYQADFSNDETTQFREIWTLYPNGEPKTVEVVFSALSLDDGRMAAVCEASPQDHHDHEALRSAEALLHTSVMITLYTPAGEPLYRNPASRSAALSFRESLQQHFVNPETMDLLNESEQDELNTVASVYTSQGERWHDITARRCHDSVSGEVAWLLSEVDVSRLKAAEERAQFLAEHDMLTGLPNRNHVACSFEGHLADLQANQQQGAVIFIDLDHFKRVNDSLGHDAGDKLLSEVAGRLKQYTQVLNVKTLARLGGDEFLLFLGAVKNADEVSLVARQVKQLLSEPYKLLGRIVRVTPSIGISLFPDNGRNLNDLMRHADLAMYHAKDNGRNDFAFFTQAMSEAVEIRVNLESELIVALQEQQFVTYFQPRVDIKTNSVTGAEALVRWNHPTRGMVSPGLFIPACESSGMICQLGKYVFEQSVQAQCEWARLGYDLQVSVNLSPLQFCEENLVEDLIEIVRRNNGQAEKIELEITESVLLGHDEQTTAKLTALVEHGFRIAIDDFGTGYSNLAYLHRYPISCLKIDRSFISEIENAQPIIELIVSMARLFKLDVVAEGVETEEQLQALRSFDCQEYQGFLFGKPVDFDTFNRLLGATDAVAAA